jgi:hypothetical protein
VFLPARARKFQSKPDLCKRSNDQETRYGLEAASRSRTSVMDHYCTATFISTHYCVCSEIRWPCTGHYSRWSGDFEKTTQNHRGLALGPSVASDKRKCCVKTAKIGQRLRRLEKTIPRSSRRTLRAQHSGKSNLHARPVRVLSEAKLKMSFISGAHTACTQNGKPSQTQLTSSRQDMT